MLIAFHAQRVYNVHAMGQGNMKFTQMCANSAPSIKPSESTGTCIHPDYGWIRIEWKIVYTTIGMDAANVRVFVLDAKNGKVVDSVYANAINDRVWLFGFDSQIMDRNTFGRRRLAMETLDEVTREIDASGWRGKSEAM